ncbi:hypothetical protein [Paeniglutamicibacter terrestris]|uniref:Uncharacterized protein n=1 Tax=Paeniglutamicibacter terrestris TaxID=2723403 RepID=A0ABX1G5Z7_9MICC|nr:hypothetical protein [Paeniglutamicibacter terrestris]NKG21136.1 hypothetical protein [Paeniglutamicibacter terrestris]
MSTPLPDPTGKPADALMLDSAKSTPTGFDIQMHAGGPKTQETLIFIADSMRGALDEYEAPNYLEMKLQASDGKKYVMTLQRQGDAVTPHEARREAEARADAAEREIAQVRLSAIGEANRAEAAEQAVARVRKALPPYNQMLDYVVPAIDILRALDGAA